MEMDYAELWARAQLAAVDEHRTQTLGPEDQFHCLALDGTDVWRNMESACDAAAFINSHPELDWATVLERARAKGSLRVVLLVAGLAHDVFGANVPPGVTAEAARRPFIQSSI